MKSLLIMGASRLKKALREKAQSAKPGKIVNSGTFNRHEAENITSYTRLMLRSTRQIQYKEYAEVNHRVLELLRKEYHLE